MLVAVVVAMVALVSLVIVRRLLVGIGSVVGVIKNIQQKKHFYKVLTECSLKITKGLTF